MQAAEILRLVVAALGGAAVGLERQWSGHAEGPSARFAGIRTFTLLGALAGLAGWFWTVGALALSTVLLAGAVALTVVGYFRASTREIDGTTEVAALVVLAAGVVAGLGSVRLASGITAVEVLVLVEKSRLHSFVRRIDDTELRAGVRFAVMALVVLPLLPDGPFGPLGAIRPRELWILVLFFSGLSFLGHVLKRAIGARHGYVISGAVGGLISSTNVTLTFARASRDDPDSDRVLAFGAVAANAVLYARVLAAVAALNAALVVPLLPYLAPPAAVAIVVVLFGIFGPGERQVKTSILHDRNPLQLSAALQMAGLFQLVLLVVRVVQNSFGRAGLLTTAVVLGLTDVDALTLSIARGVTDAVAPATAALAIAAGIVANTVLKTAIAAAFGSSRFRVVAAGTLALMIAVGAAALAVF